jgi:hypothetical protein
VWWPTRDLPFHWDSAIFVVNAARDLLASRFHPFVATHSDFAHPPLFVAALAVVWRLFGESRIVAHSLVFPALPVAMIATYRLGLGVKDRAVGAAAAALFGGVAIVLEEYGQIYMDLPVAAVLTSGLAAWIGRRHALAGAIFCVAAAMKLPAPLLVPGALGLCQLARRKGRREIPALLALGLPFVLVGVWLAYHRAITGWTLALRPVAVPHDPLDVAHGVVTLFDWLLLGQYRWILFVATVGAIVWVRVRCARWIRLAPIAPLLVVLGTSLLAFAMIGEFALRYGIYLLPPYFVATLYCVRAALPCFVAFAPGISAVFALFTTTWHPVTVPTHSYVFRPDENLAYLDVIAIGLLTSHWLERHEADAEIYGTEPEGYELAEPWQGYVERPLRFAWCRAYARHPGTTQLFVIHAYHPQQPLCLRIALAVGARPIKHFESNGRWLELYQVPTDPDLLRPDASGVENGGP